MSQYDTLIHLIAGGTAGTVGAIVTCPLEVVKTRLQSSSSNFSIKRPPPIQRCGFPGADNNLTNINNSCKSLTSSEQRRKLCTTIVKCRPQLFTLNTHCNGHVSTSYSRLTLIQCIRHIIENEGPRALFKGLIPNLIGVAPSRAIYFGAYSQSKKFLNTVFTPDTPIVHVLAAVSAGFTSSTATNPIWFIKTRLQLDNSKSNKVTAMQCVKKIYQQSGILGFYKGITASYMGISETVIHFVIYEAIKERILRHRVGTATSEDRSSKEFLEFMLAGAFSKTIASCLAYPHEVARTRLREEGNRYHSFWQTLNLVWQEEGLRGIYRGLGTQLIRQIPNTAIVMATYEAVVYVLTKHLVNKPTEFYLIESNNDQQNNDQIYDDSPGLEND